MSVKRRKKGSQINLLPVEGFSSTTFGRVLLWVLSSFRIIVIVTELIVMIAFLSRFWLDANNTDLNEELRQKSSVISAQANFEKDFKNTQSKLAILSELEKDGSKTSDSLEKVVESLPPDVFLEQLSFSEDNIQAEGFSPSELSVQQFMVNLESNNFFELVTLEKLNSNLANPSLLEFNIKGVHKL